MSVKTGFAFPHGDDDRNNAPSSGDGASCESAYDPSTGAVIPGYQAPMPSARMDTSGRNSGLGYSETGQADIRAYRETKSAVSGGAYCGGGPGLALPTGDSLGDHSDNFHTVGQIASDSNYQSTTTAGGPLADSSFVVRDGGADDGTSGPNVGGRTIA